MLRDETAASPERRAAALAGLAAFQQARRPVRRRLAPVRHRVGRATLRDYGGGGARQPVVLVPSLINPSYVLDLAPGSSLVRWLAEQGVRPLLLNWGTPGPSERDLDVTGHVERLLLPLLAKLREPPVLVGYCLGGTMALAAACARETAGLALIAAPWRFAGFGATAQAEIAGLWDAAEPTARALGAAPIEALQAGFWRLDPARTVAKYEAFGRMPPGSAEARAFVALEDWANQGAPLPYATARQLFDDFIAADLPGSGRWTVAGVQADPAALACPVIDFVSLNDRIVPAATASGVADRRDLAIGHVGMIVGRRARADLWQPLADWITTLDRLQR